VELPRIVLPFSLGRHGDGLRDLPGWASLWDLQNPSFAGLFRCGRRVEVSVNSLTNAR